jgi:hypothetical protein
MPGHDYCACDDKSEPTGTPSPTGEVGTGNPPGRDQLRYRLGVHATFKEAMRLAAAKTPGLARHTSRDDAIAARAEARRRDRLLVLDDPHIAGAVSAEQARLAVLRRRDEELPVRAPRDRAHRLLVALDTRGDELHILDPQPVEDLNEALMNYGDAEGRPAEVQRVPRHIERESRHAA